MEPTTFTEEAKPGFWKKQRTKFTDATDGLMFIVSLWATAIIFLRFRNQIELGWDYYLDEMVVILIIWGLCYVTFILLKWVVIVGLLCLTLVYGVKWFYSPIQKELYSIHEQNKNSKVPANSTEFNIRTEVQTTIMNLTGSTELEEQQDSMKLELQLLKLEIDSLKKTVEKDSIQTKKLK